MVAIVNFGSVKSPEILNRLKELGIEAKLIPHENFKLDDLENLTALVFSGAPIILHELPADEKNAFVEKYQFVKNVDFPVLGICFGHQLLSLIYGGSIGPCKPDRDWQEIEIDHIHVLINGLENPFLMKEDHREAVSLPEEFMRLGKSSICENEAMVHFTKKMAGVQFHPEVSEKNGAQFFKNFVQWANLI